MLSKKLFALLFTGSAVIGYAADRGPDYDPSTDYARYEGTSDTFDEGHTWDDGRPMSDQDHAHIGQVFLGGD